MTLVAMLILKMKGTDSLVCSGSKYTLSVRLLVRYAWTGSQRSSIVHQHRCDAISSTHRVNRVSWSRSEPTDLNVILHFMKFLAQCYRFNAN